MADPLSSHNKSHRALSLTLNPSSVSLSSRLELSLNPCSLISKSLSNELHGHPFQAHPLTAIGFIFLRSCFMGFIFFVVLVVGSSDFHCSRSRLDLGNLEQLQEEGRRWFRENGARSRPPPGPLMIVKSLFLSLF